MLIVLWTRSLSYEDGAGIALPHNCEAWVDSVRSRVLISFRHEEDFPVNPSPGSSDRVDLESLPTIERNTGPHVLGFGIIHEPGYYRLRLPHWFLASSIATLGLLPWFSRCWRFTLRTLLIATTLAAIVLGLVVYLAHTH